MIVSNVNGKERRGRCAPDTPHLRGLRALDPEGADAEQWARVVTPVGLDIGARSPEEIAVSIVGHLIARRRGL